MEISQKAHLSYGDHSSQFGRLSVPERSGTFPVVITIHGGFWQSKYNLEENNPIVEDLTRRGFATWNIEYRRVGEQGGGWPGTFHDVLDAVNHLYYLQDNRLDISEVTVIGHSAGGHLALWLASRVHAIKKDGIFKSLLVPIQKVISLAGVTNLKKMWEVHQEQAIDSPVTSLMGGEPDKEIERYNMASPIELLPLKVSQILIHGELDRHVPVSLSEEYYHQALEKGDRVRLLTFPEVEHFKLIDPTSTAWKSVINYL